MGKWKTRVDGSSAQIGQRYQETDSLYPFGTKRHASGSDLPPQPRSVESMKAPAPEPVRRSPYTDELLDYHGDIGVKGTNLYVGKDVQAEEIEDLSGSFNRLPPSAQTEIKALEINSASGKKRKVGTYEFTEGGHWSSLKKTIRVFKSTEGTRWIGFERTDDIIAHEAGHALYDKLEKQAYQEPYPSDEAYAIEDHAAKMKIASINRIRQKYEPEIEVLWKEHQKKLDERMSFWGSAEEMRKLRREDKQIEQKILALQNKRDAEVDLAVKAWDPKLEVEKLLREKQPIHTRLDAFRKASQEEGAITSYSAAWEKDPSFATENFAESMKIFYSGYIPQKRIAMWRGNYPKTYRAFYDLVEPEIRGHAVSLKYKPLRRVKLDA